MVIRWWLARRWLVSVSMSGICLSLVSTLLVSVPGFLCLCRLPCPCMTGSPTGRWLSLCTACCFWAAITYATSLSPGHAHNVLFVRGEAWSGGVHLGLPLPTSLCRAVIWRRVAAVFTPWCRQIYRYIGIIYACRPTSYLFEHRQRSLNRSHALPCFRVRMIADSVC